MLQIWFWLGEWGVIFGSVLVALPIIYDIVGVGYGRDLRLGIGFWGVVLQIVGIVCALIGKYAKREINK
jgi:hypothetical protein